MPVYANKHVNLCIMLAFTGHSYLNAFLPVRYAVTHHIVDGCTHWFGKTPISKWGWVGIVLDYLLMHKMVNFICCHANLKSIQSQNCLYLYIYTHTYVCLCVYLAPHISSAKITFRLCPASKSTCLASWHALARSSICSCDLISI